MEEQRRHPRFPVVASMPVDGAGVTCARATARDVSASGVFLEIDPPPAPGAILLLGPPGAQVQARVVYAVSQEEARGGGRRPGVGVELVTPVDPDAWLLAMAEHDAASWATREEAAVAPVETIRPALSAPSPARRVGRVVEERYSSACAKQPSPWADLVGAEVVLAEFDRDACAILYEALRLDGYAPLVARHGLEALALTLRRRPLLVVVGDTMRRLSVATFVEEVRARPELDEVRVVVVDARAAPEELAASRVVHWRHAPSSTPMARREIDRALEGARGRAVPKSARALEPVRSLAQAIFDVAQRLEERDPQEHVAALRYAVELSPSSGLYAAHLAWAMYRLGGVEQRAFALQTLERVCRQEPALPEGFLFKARICAREGRVKDARDCFDRVLLLRQDAEVAAEASALAADRDAEKPPRGGAGAAGKRVPFFASMRALLSSL